MELIKRCPTCGAENKPSEMMCVRCFGDISGIAPSGPELSAAPASANEAELVPLRLALRLPEGELILISSNDVVGRSAIGQGVLAQHGKVSRQHLQFIRSKCGWAIKDLGSANGSYLDGVRLQAHEPFQIAIGSRIGMSQSLEVLVEAPTEQ